MIDGLHLWAWVGLVPVAAAAVASWQLDRGRRDRVLVTLATTAAVRRRRRRFVAPAVDAQAEAPRR